MGTMHINGLGFVETRTDEQGNEVPVMYRQGDVFIFKMVESKHEFGPNAVVQDHAVLAEGEVTGHHHILQAKCRVELAHPNQDIDEKKTTFHKVGLAGEPVFFEVLECGENDTVELVHDEHDPIELPPGKYKSTIQRQYMPAANERVYD